MSTDSNLFGDLPIAASPQRVSGMKILEQLQLPTEPIYSDPASNDSWRQTGFNLGADLRLIQSGLDISLETVNTDTNLRADQWLWLDMPLNGADHYYQ